MRGKQMSATGDQSAVENLAPSCPASPSPHLSLLLCLLRRRHGGERVLGAFDVACSNKNAARVGKNGRYDEPEADARAQLT